MQMIKQSENSKQHFILKGIALPSVLCSLSVGCASITNLEYKEYVRELDDKNELRVSTHPAWFPKQEVNIPLVYVKMVTDEYVALSFYVRKKGTKDGSNPQIGSMKVHKFTYRLDDGPEKILLRDFPKDSWTQQTGSYAERAKKAIPFKNDSILHITADLTLNGEDYFIKGDMPARRRFSSAPIFFYYLGP